MIVARRKSFDSGLGFRSALSWISAAIAPLLLGTVLAGCHMESGAGPASAGYGETRIARTKPLPVDPPRPWQSYYHELQSYINQDLGNPFLALDETEKVLRYRPKSLSMRLRKAHLQEKIGDEKGAIQTLKKLTEDYPKRISPWLDLARIERIQALGIQDPTLRNMRFEDIITLYRQHVLPLDPLKEEVYVAIDDLYNRTGQREKGIEVLKEGVGKNPASSYLPFYLGFQLAREKDFNGARKAFALSVKRNSGFEPGWESLGDLDATLGNYPEADKYYRVILDRIHPGDPQVEGKLLKDLLSEGKTREAISFLGQVIKEHPDDERFGLILTSLLLEDNQLDRAIGEVQSIIRDNPGDEKLLSFLGSVYERSLHLPEAVDTYRLMIKRFPHSDLGYFLLGDLFRRLENPKAAIRNFLKAQKLAPGKWEIPFSISLAEMDLKRFPEARKYLARAMSIHPDSAVLYFNRGVLFDQWNHKKYQKQSQRDLERAIALDPKMADALNYLGYTWVVDHGSLTAARYLILRALTVDPKNGSFRDSIGWCYFHMGQIYKALREESTAYELMPHDATVLAHLSRIEMAVAKGLSSNSLTPRRQAIIAQSAAMASLSQKSFSKDFAVKRLREDARYHLRASIMRHPMKAKRVALYKKYFAKEDPAFPKDFAKAKRQWHLLHPGKGRPTIYRVKTGDTLETVAAKGIIYGDPRYWRTLLKANAQTVTNPNKLPWGLILKIPSSPTAIGARQDSSLGEKSPIFSSGSKGNGHVD
ncbi:MAG: tetratricopeptide repeat protein [Leptospirillum sp.]